MKKRAAKLLMDVVSHRLSQLRHQRFLDSLPKGGHNQPSPGNGGIGRIYHVPADDIGPMQGETIIDNIETPANSEKIKEIFDELRKRSN